jgi:hypothetical protein
MDSIIAAAIGSASELFLRQLREAPPEEARRLAALERRVEDLGKEFLTGLWHLIDEELGRQAEAEAGRCVCGHKCQQKVSTVAVAVCGHTADFQCAYFYCKTCHVGVSPMRRWLGIHDGDASLGCERSVAHLTITETFGEAASQLEEQLGQEFDRTKLERITYRAGEKAEKYLELRRAETRQLAMSSARTTGAEAVEIAADGGAIRTGVFNRPEVAAGVELTPVRQLPKATKDVAKREVRVVVAKPPGQELARKVDLNIAPLGHPELTGERMLSIAMEAGVRDNTFVHGVFDMGNWPCPQFEEQFSEHKHLATADIVHVAEYLCQAGKNIVGLEKAKAWGMEKKDLLLQGRADSVIRSLQAHKCTSACLKDEDGTCLAKVAHRYLKNHRQNLNYPEVIALGFSVGSGEAESAIRHLVRRRMDVAGAWKEENANRVLALLSIRTSGWWHDFWMWCEQQDLQAWRTRQLPPPQTARGRAASAQERRAA